MQGSSLRERILTGFVFFSAIQAVLVVVIAIYSYHRGEDTALAELLVANPPIVDFSAQDWFEADIPNKLKTSLLQTEIQGLSDGIHELSGTDNSALSGKELHIYVYHQDNQKRFRVLQFSEDNKWLAMLKVYSVFAMAGLLIVFGFGLWSGRTIADKISKPLEQLAQNLDLQLNPAQSGEFFKPDQSRETAIVAKALDRTFAEIKRSTEREKTLARNISHELRTPLTIIQTALDTGTSTGPNTGPNAGPNAGPDTGRQTIPSEQALSGARRACEEMELLTGACMDLSRNPENATQTGSTDIAQTVKQVIKENLHLLEGREVRVDLNLLQREIILAGSEGLTRMVTANIIRNAFLHSNDAPITITLSEKKLQVENGVNSKNHNTPLDQAPRGSGYAYGLSILGQACERLNWKFKLARSAPLPDNQQLVTATVEFAKF